MNSSAALVGEVSAPWVTVTSTTPAASGGEVAVIWLAETTTTSVAAMPPNATVAPAANPFPEMVTAVAVATAPPDGVTPVTSRSP